MLLCGLLTACGNVRKEGGSEYRVCMITDSGDITDQSFNQTTYEACRDYCREHNMDFTYKKPDGDTDYARIAMVDVAVAEGYNILVMPGFSFARAIVETTNKYPDIDFIALDLGGADIAAAAVGSAYYADPDAYEVTDYYNTSNTYCTTYREEIAGFLAGYAAVRMGYRKLGFLGGMMVPGPMRFGYGYVQGIDQAAQELGITDEVSVEYAYGGQFYGSTEITAAMDTWYNNGVDVAFACGGAIYTSVAEAAAKKNGKVITADSDQSAILDTYLPGMAVTAALKNLRASINTALDAITIDGTWPELTGQIASLGLVSTTDMSLNYVGLPEDTTQWNEGFTREDYYALVRRIYDGEVEIDRSIDSFPETEVRVNVRPGTIR
ncbi:MAG: BMP family ABC transporter substrate-binding protein [Butyrivibrio sp.]|nr:BMP family ABC transporter substrate-binding protein [Butyrivibrio sp.]